MAFGDPIAILRVFLDADPPLGVIVGNRIYAPRLPEKALLPALSFFIRGGSSNPHIPPIVEPSFQFDCWGTGPIEARSVYNALYEALQGIQEQVVTVPGPPPVNYRILSVVEEVQGQDIQPIDPQGYHRVVAFFKVVIQI